MIHHFIFILINFAPFHSSCCKYIATSNRLAALPRLFFVLPTTHSKAPRFFDRIIDERRSDLKIYNKNRNTRPLPLTTPRIVFRPLSRAANHLFGPLITSSVRFFPPGSLHLSFVSFHSVLQRNIIILIPFNPFHLLLFVSRKEYTLCRASIDRLHI